MAVPSTKAFYAQIAAGYLLAIAIADEVAHARSRASCTSCSTRCASLPDAMARVLGQQRRDRGHRAAPRGVAALLGGGRQRPQPHRRARGADQAVGALLQVDLVRRHRGQEAHRPVGRAAGARVRGRAAGLERRRRRQGDRDLPRAPCRADRDRHRGRAPLRRRARDHPRCPRCTPTSPSCSRRWPATSSATRPRSPSTPRPGRCARPAPRSQAAVSAADAGRRPARSRSSPRSSCPARRVPRRPARRRATTATSKPGTAVRIASLLRYATGHRAARRVPGRARHGRHAEPRGRGPHRRAHRRHRGAHPAGRRDQAPGQDGHGRHLAFRRGAAAGAAGARGARGGRRARRAQLPRAAHAGRARPRGRAGRRLHPLPHRGRPRRRRRDHPRRRPRRHLGRPPVAHRRRPPPASAPSTASRRNARSPWRAAGATGARW